MRIFFRRPLALSVCLAVVVACLSLSWSDNCKAILAVILLVTAIGIGIFSVLRRKRNIIIMTAILATFATSALLFTSFLWFHSVSERYSAKIGKTVTAEGYVTERLTSSAVSARFSVRLTEFDGERCYDKVLLQCNSYSTLQIGDSFRLRGSVRDFQIDDSYDEQISLQADGLVAVLVCEESKDCENSGKTVTTPAILARKLNHRLTEKLSTYLGGEEGALASAILLGNRSKLSGSTTLAFRRCGVSHLLALSGLHVSILIAIVEWVLGRARIPKIVRQAIIPPLAICYLILTGCSVSTVRAVLMVTVLSLAFLSSERYDALTALSATLFCILLATPYAVKDISLWMSYGATTAIIVFLPALRPLLQYDFWKRMPKICGKCLKGLVTAIATGLFATCGILAVTVTSVGSVSVLSVPLTLVLSPLMTVALFLGILSFLLPIKPVFFLAKLSLSAMLGITERASEWKNILLTPTEKAEWILLYITLAVTVSVAVLPLRRKYFVALPLVLSGVFLLLGSLGTFRSAGITATSVHGDGGEQLLVTEGNNSVLIDFSSGLSDTVYTITDCLSEYGESEVGDIVFTHYHARTVWSLQSIAKRVKVRRVRLPVPRNEEESAIANRIESEAERLKIKVRYDTDDLSVDACKISWFLQTGNGKLETSLGMTLEIGETVVTAMSSQLVGGDGWIERYENLVGSDVLIILSHGSGTAEKQTIRLPESVSLVIWGNGDCQTLHPLTDEVERSYVGEETVKILP